jgi:hypothetical protein
MVNVHRSAFAEAWVLGSRGVCVFYEAFTALP